MHKYYQPDKLILIDRNEGAIPNDTNKDTGNAGVNKTQTQNQDLENTYTLEEHRSDSAEETPED